MSEDTPRPGHARAPHLAYFFGQIADTTEWHHSAWLALMARLEALGKPARDVTVGEIHDAIQATQAGG